MPEGHVVHAEAARFASTMVGRPVRAASPQGRFATGAAAVDGQVLTAATAYGKHLVLAFAGGLRVHVHLGLIGAWTWWNSAGTQVAGPPINTVDDANVRLRLSLLGGAPHGAVAAELRGAMLCDLLDEQQVDAVLARLGPDPIRDDTAPPSAWDRLHASRLPIGSLLLDQTVVAGAGLIWRCEAPYLAGISPFRPGRDLTRADWDTLWSHLRLIMRAAVDQRADGHTSHSFHLFRREGEPCRACGTPIEVATLTGRKVWWCPRHQAD